MHFLEIGCNCGCSKRFREKSSAELREAFQALSISKQDIFLIAQLKAMNGGEVTAGRRLKKKVRTNKRTFYYWDRNTPLCQKTYPNMLRIGRTHLENVRNHLATNGIIPQYQTSTAMKNQNNH